MTQEFNPADLMAIFNNLFAESHNTLLVRGDDEPIYLPADSACDYNRVVFAHGYFASALHEIAHWCIAGAQRRRQVDYAYWYAPDGRSAEQQQEFERVEVKPQALEWILSSACGKSFRVSVDNLNGVETDPTPFKRAVLKQVHEYCANEIPERAAILFRHLARHYGRPMQLCDYHFAAEHIGLSSIEG